MQNEVKRTKRSVLKYSLAGGGGYLGKLYRNTCFSIYSCVKVLFSPYTQDEFLSFLPIFQVFTEIYRPFYPLGKEVSYNIAERTKIPVFFHFLVEELS